MFYASYVQCSCLNPAVLQQRNTHAHSMQHVASPGTSHLPDSGYVKHTSSPALKPLWSIHFTLLVNLPACVALCSQNALVKDKLTP